mgnify:FL=1
MNYFMAEISRGKYLELEEDKYSEKREKVYTFMKIPREFEKVRACKLFICSLLSEFCLSCFMLHLKLWPRMYDYYLLLLCLCF